MKMKVKIGWWALLSTDQNQKKIVVTYNYHVKSVANGNVLLGTNQGYTSTITMFKIIKGLFPKAEIHQERNRYTKAYFTSGRTVK